MRARHSSAPKFGAQGVVVVVLRGRRVVEEVERGHSRGWQGICAAPLVVTPLAGVLQHLFEVEHRFLFGVGWGEGARGEEGMRRWSEDVVYLFVYLLVILCIYLLICVSIY